MSTGSVLIVLEIKPLDQYPAMEKIADPKQVTPQSLAELNAQKRAAQATAPAQFYGDPSRAPRNSTSVPSKPTSRP